MFPEEAQGGLADDLHADVRVQLVPDVHDAAHCHVAQELEVRHALVARAPAMTTKHALHVSVGSPQIYNRITGLCVHACHIDGCWRSVSWEGWLGFVCFCEVV